MRAYLADIRMRQFRTRGEGRSKRKEYCGLVDNIRSAWNVGSILRSADGLIYTYLCGITSTPENEAVTKTSLGAEGSVPWSYHKNAVKLVNDLKVEGWKIYGLEEDRRGIPITRASSAGFDALASQPSALREVLIVGNEVTGVDPELLDLCDEIVHIPMRGEKKSFNVAIAFAIAAYVLTVHVLENKKSDSPL
jgi:tRNA G18 (ribose-2'-O)-methylase SpoU